MFKAAFLILVHGQPSMLARLVDRLTAPWNHAFIHVDKKCDIEPFRRAVGEGQGWTFLPDDKRVPIYWTGHRSIRATLNLMQAARAHDPAYARFTLLSGQDYPIKPLAALREGLEGDGEFIAVDRALDPKGDSWFDKRAYRLYFGDNRIVNPRDGVPNLERLIRKITHRFPVNPYGDLKLYEGAQWWSLTRAAVDDMLAQLEREPDIYRWFRYSRTSNEMFFQTLMKRSSRADQIVTDATLPGAPPLREDIQGLHYLDWHRPNPELPKVLDLEDLQRVRDSAALFARKFDTERSAGLMDALDQLNRASRTPFPTGDAVWSRRSAALDGSGRPRPVAVDWR